VPPEIYYFVQQVLIPPEIAGIAGKFIEYPFDTVKVRLQSQPDHLPLQYKGPLDCFAQSIRKDGIIGGLYRGISAPLVGAALENSSLFVWEQVAQKAVFASGNYSRDKPLPLTALYFTGAVSGAFTSLVLTPIELVKCKMQVPAVSTRQGNVATTTKPLAIIRQIFHYQGVSGFWHGQLGTFIRETGGGAAWFGSKETVSRMFHSFNAKNSPQSYNDLTPLPLWQQAVAGGLAGPAYNFLGFPADTIKSRMQTSSVDNTANLSFWKEGKALWSQHGVKGMYRGCGITCLRSAPASAFIFIIYDALKRNFSLG
jgi:ornithine carrier protein